VTAAGGRLVGVASGGERDPLGRVESLMEIITRAHAVIYTEHGRLVDGGLTTETTRRLLRESVRIVFEHAPEAARAARTLAQERALRSCSSRKPRPTRQRLINHSIAWSGS